MVSKGLFVRVVKIRDCMGKSYICLFLGKESMFSKTLWERSYTYCFKVLFVRFIFPINHYIHLSFVCALPFCNPPQKLFFMHLHQ